MLDNESTREAGSRHAGLGVVDERTEVRSRPPEAGREESAADEVIESLRWCGRWPGLQAPCGRGLRASIRGWRSVHRDKDR